MKIALNLLPVIQFKMIKEFDRIVLIRDLPGTIFVKGDIGTVVMIYDGGRGYEIEFFAADGSTLGVESVDTHDLISTEGIKKVLHIDDIAA
ncbi:MAG: DUF4926 domain-containing protein [Chitinophagales bacterium]